MPQRKNHQTPHWQTLLNSAQASLSTLTESVAELRRLGDEATAEIEKCLRAPNGPELDIDAIRATLTRPYTLLTINQHESWLIHWRGVRMPIMGWVVKQEASFTLSRISRSMDLITPLPDWMKQEMGWRPPEHNALIDPSHTSIAITHGDADTFKKKYGAFLGTKTDDGYRIKGGDAWIKLVSALIRDGILPYGHHPIDSKHWDDKAKSEIVLRDYQSPYMQEFKSKGAVLWNLPPGGGKTYLALYVMAHFKLPILLFAPSVILCEQWRERIRNFAPNADVTILTYASGKKAKDRKWGLVIFDEVQTLPANEYSKLAFLDTEYRIGMTGSAWREDGRQHMITALSGHPCSIRWADLIRAGVLKRPRVFVVILPNEKEKDRYVQRLLSEKRPGRTLIFCDFIERGKALASAIDLPFVHGSTPNKYKMVNDSPACVVSRIADRGLDFDDLSLVIEVAFLGGSREQEAQRLGRLLHSQKSGDHFLLFTPQEADKFKARIYGIEVELAGEVEITFINQAKGIQESPRPIHERPSRGRTARVPRQAHKASGGDVPAPQEQSNDPISQAERLPAVSARLSKAEGRAYDKARVYIRRIFRYCFDAQFSVKEIMDGLGLRGTATAGRIGKACSILTEVELLIALPDGRFTVDRQEIKRIEALTKRISG